MWQNFKFNNINHWLVYRDNFVKGGLEARFTFSKMLKKIFNCRLFINYAFSIFFFSILFFLIKFSLYYYFTTHGTKVFNLPHHGMAKYIVLLDKSVQFNSAMAVIHSLLFFLFLFLIWNIRKGILKYTQSYPTTSFIFTALTILNVLASCGCNFAFEKFTCNSLIKHCTRFTKYLPNLRMSTSWTPNSIRLSYFRKIKH